MNHFDITEWTDAVRNAAPRQKQERMSAHLDTGCARCGEMAGALERVAKLASGEAETAPPNHAIRSVRAYFALNQPTRRTWLGQVALGLDFDSSLERVPVNTRGEDARSRQLTYCSDEYTLDLTVDPSDGSEDAGITGYCLRRAGEPVAGAPVFLICRGQFAGQGTTGELGEFQFDTELTDPLELWLFDDNDLPVAVNLEIDKAT